LSFSSTPWFCEEPLNAWIEGKQAVEWKLPEHGCAQCIDDDLVGAPK